MRTFADVNGIGAARFLSFLWVPRGPGQRKSRGPDTGNMEKEQLLKVLRTAAEARGCVLADLDFNDDDNVFTATIDRPGGNISLEDCETVHRAVLKAFDRNVEDYSMTVTSAGIDAEEADRMLETIKD